ncbi:hypothetical protein [Rubricoccus marinus]|uniref:hypothetical protein n=1 Tax=Rubricoccus marinus TaxID=716817 RepID=UPI00117AEE77|nr:hypothetical protein [Rubricoccus marinus]
MMVALYAWHPLAVLEIAGQGHSEGLAIGFLSIGLAALVRRNALASGGWLALAGWSKLWPFALLAIWARAQRRVLVSALLISVALIAPILAQTSGAITSLGLYAGTFDFYSAPYAVLKSALWPLAAERSGLLASLALGLTALVASAVIAIRSHRELGTTQLTGWFIFPLILTSPTLHPWHLLPLLWFAVLIGEGRVLKPVLWLVAWSPATYLVYVGLPSLYTAAIVIGWTGAVLLASLSLIPHILEQRGRRKWTRIQRALGSGARSRLLDFGGAEGFVAAAAQAAGREAVIADIEDVRRVEIPFLRVVADRVEASPGAFEDSCLVFVLHHADRPGAVLDEARRVTRGRIIVWETTPRRWYPKPLLHLVDRITNSLRPTGHAFPSAKLRTPLEWESMFERHQLQVSMRTDWGVLHPQTFWLLTSELNSRGASFARG